MRIYEVSQIPPPERGGARRAEGVHIRRDLHKVTFYLCKTPPPASGHLPFQAEGFEIHLLSHDAKLSFRLLIAFPAPFYTLLSVPASLPLRIVFLFRSATPTPVLSPILLLQGHLQECPVWHDHAPRAYEVPLP